MCGIIGVVSRPPTRPTPSREELIGGLDDALAAGTDIAEVARRARVVDRLLRGLPGVLALTEHVELVAELSTRLDRLDALAAATEADLDGDGHGLDPYGLEQANADLIALKDALWAVRHDRLRSIAEVAALAGRDA